MSNFEIESKKSIYPMCQSAMHGFVTGISI